MVDVSEPPAEIAPAPAARAPTPSLVTAAPLGTNNYGMTIGGGYTAILPLFLLELGYGVSRRVDLAFRYETVSGVFHYPQLAVRWAFADVGPWTLATRLGANYSLFAVKSDQLNLTSTFYLTGDLIASRPVTASTDFVASVRADFDLWEFRIVDGSKHAVGTYRFDAMTFRVGARTQATDDLSVYLIGALRVPTESFTYRAEQFYVLPTVEVGGTFVW